MIDLFSEKLISLPQAAKLFPCSQAGRTVHVGAVYRAAKRGHGGVRLETVRTPRLATSREAVARYFEALTARSMNPEPPRPRHQERRRHEHVSAALDRLGL
jgi:hypothetical protein